MKTFLLTVLGIGMVAMLVGLTLSVSRYRELCDEERSVKREREELNRWTSSTSSDSSAAATSSSSQSTNGANGTPRMSDDTKWMLIVMIVAAIGSYWFFSSQRDDYQGYSNGGPWHNAIERDYRR